MRAGRRSRSRGADLHKALKALESLWVSERARRASRSRHLGTHDTYHGSLFEKFPTIIPGPGPTGVEIYDGPSAARKLLGVSQAEMGILLGVFGRAYMRSTICKWEHVGITQSRKNPHKITSRGRRAYRELLNLVVKLVVGDDYYIRARMWRGPWKIEIRQYKK